MDIDLRQGDCLEILPTIASGSVDMVLCDLPYGTTACAWDAVIPFEPLWAEYKRIVKPEGAIVLTASMPFTAALVMSNPKMFRYCWVWEKEQGVNFMLAKKQPMKVHEDICVFSQKGSRYFPQMTEGKPYVSGKGTSGDVTGNVAKVQTVNAGTRYPRSVQFIKREVGLHPTQKPVALMEYLIRTYTNPQDTVLDNTMGSGTTGVACRNTGRNFIGIERDPGYFAIAEQRISGVPIAANDNAPPAIVGGDLFGEAA